MSAEAIRAVFDRQKKPGTDLATQVWNRHVDRLRAEVEEALEASVMDAVEAMPSPSTAELEAVARCLAAHDGRHIGGSEWVAHQRAVYLGRAQHVFDTIANVQAGRLSGGLPR